jgi:hypothetical protein
MRQAGDLVQPGQVAVHAEHAVGGDQAGARAGGSHELRLEVRHVAMAVAVARRLAQADAVDDGGVVQLVADHGILPVEQGLEQAGVGVEAGGIQDGVIRLQKAGDCLLQLLVQVLRSADEAHRRHTEAVGLECRGGRPHQLRVVGKAEVVIGAEVQYLACLAGGDLDTLRAGDDAFALVEALCFDGLQFGVEAVGRGFHAWPFLLCLFWYR